MASNRPMQPASMENRRIYPPSRVVVSNPFIIETSRALPDKGAEDVSFFFHHACLYEEQNLAGGFGKSEGGKSSYR